MTFIVPIPSHSHEVISILIPSHFHETLFPFLFSSDTTISDSILIPIDMYFFEIIQAKKCIIITKMHIKQTSPCYAISV